MKKRVRDEEEKEDRFLVLVDPFCDRNDEYVAKLNRDFSSSVGKFRIVHVLNLPHTHRQNVADVKRDAQGDLKESDVARIRQEALTKLREFAKRLSFPVEDEDVELVEGNPSVKEALVALLETATTDEVVIVGPRQAVPSDLSVMAKTHLGSFADFASHCTDLRSYC